MRGLYGMADADFGDPAWQARLLADNGACCVQLRCKGWSRDRLASLVEGLDLSIPVLVNDHVGLADGTHLGQGDGPLGDHGIRGRSTRTLADIDIAANEGATYVGFGPVFPTTTKNIAEVQGLDRLRAAVLHAPMPVVAIGGITLEGLPQLVDTGVACWAVISGVWRAADPAAAIRAFSEAGSDPPGPRAAPAP
jgi:thiamine-phosphate pyrophosphorylase